MVDLFLDREVELEERGDQEEDNVIREVSQHNQGRAIDSS
jgi:hypothetical protein